MKVGFFKDIIMFLIFVFYYICSFDLFFEYFRVIIVMKFLFNENLGVVIVG